MDRRQGYHMRRERGTFYNNKPYRRNTFPHRGFSATFYHNDTQRSQHWRSINQRPPQVGHRNRDRDCTAGYSNINENVATQPELTPEEQDAINLTNLVYAQQGVKSKLIFLDSGENISPAQLLQNAVDCCNGLLTLENTAGVFILRIDGEELARGTYDSKQIAKNTLAEIVVEDLKKYCFSLIKKKIYEDVDTEQNPTKEPETQNSMQGSKALQMMLKMGWGGKGLGLKEQGEEKTVAEKIEQNITRKGLGSMDVFSEIDKSLKDFAMSNKLTILRFAPDFSSEERAQIHKLAQKYNLKSKSEGSGQERRITISKKLNRRELVYQLLVEGGENLAYKLIIPTNFESLDGKEIKKETGT